MIFVLFIQNFAVAVALAREICDLDKLPIRHSKSCSSFLPADKELNENYKKLISRLDRDQRLQLLKSQRIWLKWKNSTCENAQEKVSCDNNFCMDVEHDSCQTKLTYQRSEELLEFLSNTKNPDLTFDFDREY